MHSLGDRYRDPEPMEPHNPPLSAWDSHFNFSRFTGIVGALVASGYYWGFIILGMIRSGIQGAHRGTSWSILTNNDTSVLNFVWEGEAPTSGLLWGLAILVGFQGGIVTTALTCTQTLISMAYDERLWREVVSLEGSDPFPGILKPFVICWQTVAILIAEPTFHWLFGLAVGVTADTGFHIRPIQVSYATLICNEVLRSYVQRYSILASSELLVLLSLPWLWQQSRISMDLSHRLTDICKLSSIWLTNGTRRCTGATNGETRGLIMQGLRTTGIK